MSYEEEKRYFDNPYPDFNSSDSYFDAVTVHDSDGTTKLSINSNLGIKIVNATDRLLHIVENAYSFENVRDYSIYSGLSGILYLYHALGKEVDESMVQACLESKSLKKRLGYLGGISGPLAYASAYSKTHKRDYLKTLMSLKDSQLFEDSPEEFLYGKAGYLYALLFVKNANPTFTELDDVIRTVIDVLLRKGTSASSSTLNYKWHEKEYLGAAHGYAGILSSLLRAKTYLSTPQIDLIHSKVDELMRLQLPSGNFPSSISSSKGDKLVHWCHGAPGFADLYLLAFDIFKDQKYLQVAERCLDNIWKRGFLKKGFGLCHGSSGNGYAFLLAYKSTKNMKFFYRALRFAEWCSDFNNPKCQTPDRPFSLFEGLAGNLFFLHHIQNYVDKAYFPCYSF